MPFGLVRVCKVVTAQESRAVTEVLEADSRARWSAGLVSYTGEETATGSVVTEVWATREAQQQFLADRHRSAMDQPDDPPVSIRK